MRGEREEEQESRNEQREAAQVRRPVKGAELYGDPSRGRKAEAWTLGGSSLG